jgi:hypothetical protein
MPSLKLLILVSLFIFQTIITFIHRKVNVLAVIKKLILNKNVQVCSVEINYE